MVIPTTHSTPDFLKKLTVNYGNEVSNLYKQFIERIQEEPCEVRQVSKTRRASKGNPYNLFQRKTLKLTGLALVVNLTPSTELLYHIPSSKKLYKPERLSNLIIRWDCFTEYYKKELLLFSKDLITILVTYVEKCMEQIRSQIGLSNETELRRHWQHYLVNYSRIIEDMLPHLTSDLVTHDGRFAFLKLWRPYSLVHIDLDGVPVPKHNLVPLERILCRPDISITYKEYVIGTWANSVATQMTLINYGDTLNTYSNFVYVSLSVIHAALAAHPENSVITNQLLSIVAEIMRSNSIWDFNKICNLETCLYIGLMLAKFERNSEHDDKFIHYYFWKRYIATNTKDYNDIISIITENDFSNLDIKHIIIFFETCDDVTRSEAGREHSLLVECINQCRLLLQE